MNKINVISLILASLWVTTIPVFAATNGGDPGAQLRQAWEQMERATIEREMEARREESGKTIEDQQEKPVQQAGLLRFKLEGIRLDESAVLPKEKRDEFAAEWLGREVSVEDLYKIVRKINDWYRENGYITCRAYLPAQTIHKGVVHIVLIEGRTGEIKISGNVHTRPEYIRSRMDMATGNIENMRTLDKNISRFNATNDVALHLTIRAGKEKGTTDYELTVREPQNSVTTLYFDGAGNESTGRWRSGVFYSNHSLSGFRDSLNLGYLHARGLESFSSGYSFPISRKGTRLGIDYSTNATKVVDGLYRQWNMETKGHASSVGLSLRHPIRANSSGRTEVSLAVSRQHSVTDVTTIRMVDDTFTEGSASVAFLHYAGRKALYHRYSFIWGNWNNDSFAVNGSTDKSYGFLTINSVYQQGAAAGQLFTARANAQWGGGQRLSASKQFYLGGAYSVRGYKENAIGAESGFSLNLEYAVPVRKDRALSLYGFFDVGSLWGSSSPQHHTLAGTGLGLRARAGNTVALDMALAFPLRRTLDFEETGKSRVHLNAMVSF